MRAAAVVVFWALLTAHAFTTGFSPDDLMNLHSAWTKSWGELALKSAAFWTAEDRPLTQALYRAVYLLAGFHPLPFRVLCFVLLAGNLVLQYLLARRLCGSARAAAFTAAAAGVHLFLWDLYSNTGSLFDILCGTLSFAWMLLYARVRHWTAPVTLGLAVLAILAIDAKEMGLALGAAGLLWTLLVDRRRPNWRQCLLLLPGLVYVLYRVWHPGSISRMEAYQASFTWERLSTSALAYTNLLLTPYAHATLPVAVLLWVAVAAAAALISRRALWGLLFFWTMAAPLLTVPPRLGGYVLYIPLFGLALAGGEALLRWGERKWAVAAAFSVLALMQLYEYRSMRTLGLAMSSEIMELDRAVPAVMRRSPPPDSVLVLNSPLDSVSEHEGMYVFSLHLRRRGPGVRMRRWDPESEPLSEPGAGCVLLYDRAARGYRDITAEAHAGIPRRLPPSAFLVNRPEAAQCVLSGVDQSMEGLAQWTLQDSTYRFTAGPQGASAFVIDLMVPSQILDPARPLRIEVEADDAAAGMHTISSGNRCQLAFPLAKPVEPRRQVSVRVHTANAWYSESERRYMGFLLFGAGLK